ALEVFVRGDQRCVVLHGQGRQKCVVDVVTAKIQLRAQAGQQMQMMLARFDAKHSGLLLQCFEKPEDLADRSGGFAQGRQRGNPKQGELDNGRRSNRLLSGEGACYPSIALLVVGTVLPERVYQDIGVQQIHGVSLCAAASERVSFGRLRLRTAKQAPSVSPANRESRPRRMLAA